MPKQPTDITEPLVAFTYAGTVQEPNSLYRGLFNDHKPNGQHQYRRPEQEEQDQKQHPLRGNEPEQTPRSGVGQDKNARLRDRTASLQAATQGTGERSQAVPDSVSSTGRVRVQNRAAKRRTVPVTAWASPALKAEIQRLAQLNDLSFSATMVGLLEKAIQQSLHEQHAALLQPLVQQAVRREMRGLGNRLASLLISILYVVSQIRQLLINALVRLPRERQMSEEVLNAIRDGSAERARQEVRQHSPQLAALIKEEMARWND